MQSINSTSPSTDDIQPSRFSSFNLFKQGYERYEGVPKINIHLSIKLPIFCRKIDTGAEIISLKNCKFFSECPVAQRLYGII